MIQKKEIIDTLETSLKLLEKALSEREEEQRALLYACKVTKLDDIDDSEMYKIGAELDSQIDSLRDLIDEIKWQLRYIGAFKNV